jgi:predicted ribosome quality control (RQC) complex YloA/Tae2 family protein
LNATVISKIPFDALTLASVCRELEPLIGSKLQGARQPNEDTIVLELYSKGQVFQLLVCCHAEYFRVHFVARKPSVPKVPPTFCATLRSRLDGSTLEDLRMKSGDRVLVMDFGGHRLIAELMGKHSNIILIDNSSKVVSACKWVGISKSRRPILPNGEYTWPPVLRAGEDLRDFSDFAKLFTRLGSRVVDQPAAFQPGFAAGIGAYPLDLSATIPQWLDRESLSVALENHYGILIPTQETEQLRNSITAQMERVLLARETALHDLYEQRDQGGKAALWQRYGELLLAFAAHTPAGSSLIDLCDYDGSPLTIKLNPEKTPKECALTYFEKAKKAKGRMGLILDQIERIETDKASVESFLFKILEAKSVAELDTLHEEIKRRRWLHIQPVHKDGKPERAYEGHRIRELLGPGGVRILYGENAESNDYLTLRVAKGNDWWLHVRGHTSAHVVVMTNGHPEKISREVLLFAAKVSVQNSHQKHAGYVAVDYTLKKYVRKPRGAAKGSALYTHEKTLHVEG